MKNLSTPRRLSVKEIVAYLNLPDTKSLFKLRAACKRGILPCSFPSPGPGGFLESEVHAFKTNLDAIVAAVGNTQPTNPPLDRRANINRRAL